jgi:hypothetical protein
VPIRRDFHASFMNGEFRGFSTVAAGGFTQTKNRACNAFVQTCLDARHQLLSDDRLQCAGCSDIRTTCGMTPGSAFAMQRTAGILPTSVSSLRSSTRCFD